MNLLLAERDYTIHGISRSPEKGPVFLPYLKHGGDRFTFHRLDMNKDLPAIYRLLDEIAPDYVVNFAALSEVAPSWVNPGQWFQTNVVALAGLVRHLADRPYLRNYVHISTPEVYGTCVGTVKEDALLNPSTPYAVSKAAADMLIFTFHRQYRFPFVMIRSTNVYGAHQQLHKIIPRTFIYLKLGKVVELHGGGRAVKSYIHIRDVSGGELAVMERGRSGQIYHLSPDRGISVRDLVTEICALRGADPEKSTRVVDERPGQDAAYVIDSSKARREFGWEPKVGLREGLTEVGDWIDREWEIIRNEPRDYIHKP